MTDVLTETTSLPPTLVGSGQALDAGPRAARPKWIGGTIGTVLLLVVWEILAILLTSKKVLPTPVAVARQMWNDRTFYTPHIKATLAEAAQGWLWGNLLAIGVAVVFVLVPVVEKALLRVAIATYAMPIIAIGPILQIVFNGNRPKIILAGLSVFFTTLIGALLGLRSADRISLDVIQAYGGNSWTALRKVRLRAALPNLFAGLKIAAPAALLGAIIGEYLGGERGLGVAMINSQQALAIPRTWGIALVATALAGIGYGLTAVVGRLLTPWAPRGSQA